MSQRFDLRAGVSEQVVLLISRREIEQADFVLAQYVEEGVDELESEKLSPLLRLRYKALSDAFTELGKPEDVRRVFVGFQRHLYSTGARRS